MPSIAQTSTRTLAFSLSTTVSKTAPNSVSGGKTCQKTDEENNKANRKLHLGDVRENAHKFLTFRWTIFGHEYWPSESSDN